MPGEVPVLVTGGAGYVGSHACKALHRAGFLPVVYDNLSNGHKQSVQWGPLVQGDILDADALSAAFQTYKPVSVLHFAALAYVGDSMNDPSAYYMANVVGTLRLLEVMQHFEVKTIVFSSSCATYGAAVEQPICEKQPQNPVNPYGRTKLMVENILADYGQAYQLRSACLRYFNAAGADLDAEIGEMHDPEPHLIPNVLKAAVNQVPVVIHGKDYPTYDGTCVRDYVHVNDLAAAHVSALKILLNDGETFACNLGTEQGHSILEIINATEEILGRKIERVFGPRRPGDPPVLVAKTSAAREKLHWEPGYSDLQTIISTAWRWYSQDKYMSASG